MSRKYRQRGYQDEERSERKPRQSGAPERREGPRGRGFGSPKATVFRCARCGEKQTGPVVEESRCPACGSDLHSCANCRHFDTGAVNECRIEGVVRIAAKSTRNDCREYEAKRAQEQADEAPEMSDPRAAFDALFDL